MGHIKLLSSLLLALFWHYYRSTKLMTAKLYSADAFATRFTEIVKLMDKGLLGHNI